MRTVSVWREILPSELELGPEQAPPKGWEWNNRMLLIGVLDWDNDGYRFTYDPAYVKSSEPALFHYPDKAKTYRSAGLPMFFQQRIPPLKRPDVAAFLKARGIDENDPFELLLSLGSRGIKDPYVLRPVCDCKDCKEARKPSRRPKQNRKTDLRSDLPQK